MDLTTIKNDETINNFRSTKNLIINEEKLCNLIENDKND